MTEQRVSSRYAKAVFEIVKEQGKEKAILDDFQSIRKVIDQSREFRLFLENPVIMSSVKKNVFNEAFGNKADKVIMRLINILTDNGREILIPSIASCYENIYNEDAGILPAVIITAHELNEQAKKNLTNRLSKITGKMIIPDFRIDSSILGGIKFQMDDKIFDTSVKLQLNRLFDSLVTAK